VWQILFIFYVWKKNEWVNYRNGINTYTGTSPNKFILN
jgi:hypothetical protein